LTQSGRNAERSATLPFRIRLAPMSAVIKTKTTKTAPAVTTTAKTRAR
jgi:hypothetical protein